MRGFRRERPKPVKSTVNWDLKLVLEFFRSKQFASWDSISDRELTLKTVFLLSLATGKNRSELHAFTYEGTKLVHGDNPGVILHPEGAFVSKTHLRTGGLGALRPVFVPSLTVEEDSPESSLLCPVVALRHYLSRSRAYRSPTQKNLFISWVPGHLSDIRPQTLSNYIKQAVLLAYKEADSSLIESLKIKPHSVRHVSTSLIALSISRLMTF